MDVNILTKLEMYFLAFIILSHICFYIEAMPTVVRMDIKVISDTIQDDFEQNIAKSIFPYSIFQLWKARPPN